ncbi:unnamed protein product, partial [Musa textilis]
DTRYAVSSCTARYGRYVPVRQDTGTRTALYRAVRLVSPVSVDTEIYRAVTVDFDRIPVRGPPCIDWYYFFIFLLINKYFLMLGDVTEARVTSPRLWRRCRS